jgi:hypothetical protein
MLISHTKKFIFVHNFKVAGTSLRVVLNPVSCNSFLRSDFSTKWNMALGETAKIYSKNFYWHLIASKIKKNLE